MDGVITPYVPSVSEWTTISAATGFGGAPKALTGNISSEIETLDQTEFRFTGNFIEGTNNQIAEINIGANSNGWNSGIRFTLDGANQKMTVAEFITDANGVVLTNILNGKNSVNFAELYTDFDMEAEHDIFVRIQYVDNDVYAIVYLNQCLDERRRGMELWLCGA